VDLLPVAFTSLPPRVTREQAIDAFRPGTIRRTLGGAPLQSVADVYVPYRLFRVEIAERMRRQISYVAVDALRGMLDPYQFDRPIEEADLVTMTSPNRLPVALDIDAASQVVIDAVRRILFQTGVYRLRAPRISVQHEPIDLHVPYFLGFYGSVDGSGANGSIARLRVLDAVRRRFEGAKARALFEAWLAA
jgi:hypothetical protein